MQVSSEGQHFKEWFWISAVALVVLIVVLLLGHKNYAPSASPAMGNVPDYFTAGALGQKTVNVSGDASYQLRPVETISQGSQFEVAEPYTTALADYTTKMSANGWIAVGGSTQTTGETVIKMAHQSDVMFVRFQEVSGDANKTLITVVPVTVNSTTH